jgi:chemotaxis protein MotB
MKTNSEWMSISDMMSGLMLVFMFIAISFMIQIQIDKDRMKEIAKTYTKDKKELNNDLYIEFSDDLKKWDAKITEDNVVVFNSPNVLFGDGRSDLKRAFKTVLKDFFPRYIKVLSSKKYKDEIYEVRVEGHTTNRWASTSSKQEIYLNNMKLSQNRANNVLSYCYSINKKLIKNNRNWIEKHFRANGMAFSQLNYKDKEKKIQDTEKSRRVEFRVQMKTEEKIFKILEASS